MLVLYVDDIVIAGSDLAEVEMIKADFKKRFEMKDLGEVRYYLGMTIERNCSDSIKVHQADYARTVIKRYQRYLKAGNRHRDTIPMTRDMKNGEATGVCGLVPIPRTSRVFVVSGG